MNDQRFSRPRGKIRPCSAGTRRDARTALLRRPLSAAVSAIVAATPSLVLAQTEPLEVFIVTAMRREANVQDLPLNIAAFDGRVLAEREISDLAELGRNVPGLYVVDQGKRDANRIVVRGLNLDSMRSPEGLVNTGGGTVATYVGEIPIYVDLALNDIDRVEVLLGPQGTLYGSGTLGGAIRYIPRRPELEVASVGVRASTFSLAESDDAGWRGGLTGNVPIGENFALRASLDYVDDPGFTDTPFLVRESGVSDPEPDFGNPADVAANLRGVKDADTEEILSGRVGLRWQPTERLDTHLTYFYQDAESGGRTQNHELSFGTDRYTSATRYPEPNERTNRIAALEFIADLDFAELTSATGYGTYRERGQRDQTDLLITLEYSYEAFPSFSAFTREDSSERTLTQELRLVSQNDGPLSWIGGVFYLNQTTSGLSSEFTPHWDQYMVDNFDGEALRPDSLEYYSAGYSDLKERALFGEIGYEITDRWQFTVGGRFYDYTYETRSGATTPLLDTVFNGLPPDEIDLELQTNGQKDDGFLYKVNTSYRFTDDVMGYVTISEGYRIGSSNGVAPCPIPLPDTQILCAQPDEVQYFPDKTTNYELGLRSQWLEQRLTFNASLYYIDWQDPQLASATASGALPITKNGEGARSTGIELSLRAQVTDRLDVGFSYAHTDAELTKDAPSLLTEAMPPGFGTEFVDGRAGDRLPGSPRNQGTFTVSYDVPLSGAWGLELNYGLNAIGGVLTKPAARAGGEELGGYTVHFGSAVLRNGPWRVGVYGQNLSNKFAVTGVRSSRPYIQTVADENGDAVRVRAYGVNVLRPREVGLRFSYDLDL